MTKPPDSHTRPERYAEISAAKQHAKRVRELGGCGACIHRDKGVRVFGRSVCSIRGRLFPTCLNTSTQFEPDREVLGL